MKDIPWEVPLEQPDNNDVIRNTPSSFSFRRCRASFHCLDRVVCVVLCAMSERDYYYCTHSFTEDERQALQHFFGRDLFSGSESSSAGSTSAAARRLICTT